MSRDQHIQELLATLIRAVELSLAAHETARAAVAEILKRGAETGSSFRFDESDPTLVLTPQDREFLRALSLRLEDR